MDIEQTAVIIRDAIRDIPKRYSQNLDDIKRLEKERIDLLHLIELVDLNARDGFKVYKELQKVQRERRKLKDENEELKHLVPDLTNMKNKVDKFNQSIGAIRKTKTNREGRSYRCRARKDLENIINGVKE
ncbi:hypothetical protein [Oceanobacillus profundus]|uniref:hypothetical protein n=1 Tax=Oceanobacillus profundus TaxID=372463 RepID=UPI0026E25CEF|nr:hypothetical protein [Oceanobacillus profundus]MDO6451743.1 hypothetical protein [Oceanobacillus profundus]